MRFTFCFTPVELGLEFLLTARIGWLENEKKVKVKPIAMKEFQFDSVPEDVVQKLNDKKLTLMDFFMIKLERVLEGKELFVLAKENVLGSSKTLVGTLENEITSWFDFPVSLKTFESAFLIGDISQRDIRRNKSAYQLRNTSVEDEVVLMWINVEDIRVVKQRKHDMELVELANAVKLGDDEAAAGNVGKKDWLGSKYFINVHRIPKGRIGPCNDRSGSDITGRILFCCKLPPYNEIFRPS